MKRRFGPIVIPTGDYDSGDLFFGAVEVAVAIGILLVETGAVSREALVAAIAALHRAQQDCEARPGRRLAAEVLLNTFALPQQPDRPKLTVVGGTDGAA